MIAPRKLPFGIKRPDDDENDDNDDAGDNEDDDNDDVDDNGRESAVWGLPGFYSHFPSPGRAPNYPPYWGGWGGAHGMGRGSCGQIPAFLEAMLLVMAEVGYGRIRWR